MFAGRLSACVPLRPDHAGPPAPVHHGSRRRTRACGHPDRVGRGGLVVGLGRPPLGARGRPRLLRVRLECAGRARRRTGARPMGHSAGRGAPPPVRGRSRFRRRRGGRTAADERVGVRRGPRRRRGRSRLGGPEHGRVVPLGRRPARPRRTHRGDALPADLVARGARALAGRTARGRCGGLLERPGGC